MIVLASFMFCPKVSSLKGVVWFDKIFLHPSITLIIQIESAKDIEREGKLRVCVSFFLVLYKQPREGGEHFHAKPRQSKGPRDTLDRTSLLGTRD